MPYNERDKDRKRSRSPPREQSRSRYDDRPNGSSSRRHEDRHRSSRDDNRHRSTRRNQDRHRSRRDDDRQRSSWSRNHSPESERDRRHSSSRQEERQGSSTRDERPSSLSAPPPPPDENAPNFSPSGLLAKESNNKYGVALKYHEPPEARKPKKPWRMYIFKDGKEIDMLTLGAGQSAYLLGRDRIVTDIPLDHTSCSKQHAVIQFRQTIERIEFGDKKKRTRPFLIDLESANGCTVNEKEVPPSRFFEIKNGDTIKFGASSREYVMLDEGAA